MKRNLKGKGSDLLQTVQTNPTNFVPVLNPAFTDPEYAHNFPYWRPNLVPTMRRDPKIRYGLNLLKGPIQSYTVFLPEEEADNPVLHETIREQGIQFVYAVKCKDKESKSLF